MDTSEKRFESDIESFLISDAGGYEQFSYLNPNGHRIHKYVYDKEKALYPEGMGALPKVLRRRRAGKAVPPPRKFHQRKRTRPRSQIRH